MPFDLTSTDLVECLICGRHFEESRLCKHQEICKRSAKSKRKPFDSFRQRIRGTPLENHLDNIKIRKQQQITAKMNHGNWRKDHEDFIMAVKEAKERYMSRVSRESPKDPCTPSVPKSKMPAA